MGNDQLKYWAFAVSHVQCRAPALSDALGQTYLPIVGWVCIYLHYCLTCNKAVFQVNQAGTKAVVLGTKLSLTRIGPFKYNEKLLVLSLWVRHLVVIR